MCRALSICETWPKHSLYDWEPGVGVLTDAPFRAIPPSNEVYVSCPAVALMIFHLSSSPPEFVRKMESIISLSILLASLADDPPPEAPCWGFDPPEVCFLCPELDVDFCCRSVFCGGSVFDEPITHHVGSSPTAKSSDYLSSSVFILVEVDYVPLLCLLLSLLQPAQPFAPILILSSPISCMGRQADGVDVHCGQCGLIDHIKTPQELPCPFDFPTQVLQLGLVRTEASCV